MTVRQPQVGRGRARPGYASRSPPPRESERELWNKVVKFKGALNMENHTQQIPFFGNRSRKAVSRIVTVTLIALGLFGAINAPASAFTLIERTSMLDGRIVDGATGHAIDNATLTITGQMGDGSVRQTTLTNHGGHYLIGLLLPAVQYQAFVQADGYQPLGGVVGDVNGGSGGIIVVLSGNGRVTHHDFTMLPAVQNTP